MKGFEPSFVRIFSFILLTFVWIITGASCNLSSRLNPDISSQAPFSLDETPTATTSLISTSTVTPSKTLSSTPTPTETHTPAPSQTRLPTMTELPSRTPTETPTPTITPTYAILRGKVLQQSNCRYGPGAPYLYKYGLYPDTVLEIIGRNELGTWVVIRAIGGTNPCWVKASLLQIRGDVMSVAPTYLPLPQSPYYGPPTGVSAVRNGNDVTIAWNAVFLRAGDDSEQVPYLIEAWICTQGKLVFTPIGSYATLVTIQDEPGCSEPSHGWLYAAEKHGYTTGVTIPWPQQP